nr:hypothetical protein [uncultured Undibacterium sp.]
MRAHVIENGKVVNTIEVDTFDVLPNLIDASLGGQIGDGWDGTVIVPAQLPIVVPVAVTMRQARLALLQAGKLSAVNAAIASMSGIQGEAARIEWEFSNEVKRAQPLVAALAPVLGMTSDQLDQLFITAAGL